MINKNTIISSFNEKATLMKWLKAVEAALDNASLSTVQLITVSDTQVRFSFVFADGSSVTSPTLTLPQGPTGAQGPQGPQGPQGETGATGPQGPQGPKGDDGSSVRILPSAADCTQLGDGYIDNSGHLQVLTALSPRTFSDAGEIRGPQGPQGPQGETGATGATGAQGPQGETGATGAQGPQGPAGQNGVGVPTGGTQGQVLKKKTSTDYDTEWTNDTEGMANPMTTLGDLIYGALDGAPVRLGKGTAGQVLTMNSGATAPEWQTPRGGGGTKIYGHALRFGTGSSSKVMLITTTISTPITDFSEINPATIFSALFGTTTSVTYTNAILQTDMQYNLVSVLYYDFSTNSWQQWTPSISETLMDMGVTPL